MRGGHEEKLMTQTESKGAPLFSVVIPLYNKRLFIRRAADSVLGQTFKDFELIVIDDGSTDGSHEMLADIADPRFRLVRQANAGEGPARNTGIHEAVGEWVAFLDGDDMWLPGHLEELQQMRVAFPDAGLLGCGSVEAREGGDLKQLEQLPRRIEQIDYFVRASREIGFINASSVAVRRAIFEKAGGFGPFKVGADLECWARVALHNPVAVSNQRTAIYFRGTGGVMDKLSPVAEDRPIARLEDLSPSVAMLAKAIEKSDYSVPLSSLETYINGRLFATILGALRFQRLRQARSAMALTIGITDFRLAAVRIILFLPDAALRPLLGVAVGLRSRIRRMRVPLA